MIEPLGGLARRATYVDSVLQGDKNVVVLDAGDVFGNSGLQGQIKAETTVEAMGMMSYNILNLCDHEFNYGVEFLLDNTEQFNVPTISANVVYEDTGSSITAPHKIVEFDKFKVGFIGIVSTEYEEAILESNEINERRIMLLDEKAALQEEIDEIDDEVDIIIVLAHVGMENATSIAEEIEGIDVIICGHGDEITEEPSLINGVYVVKAAYYGMEVGNLVLTLANNRIISIEGSIVTLDDSISEDEELLLLMDTYHDRIEEHKDELLDIEQKDPDEGWYYTGYAICESCHQSQTEHWGSTDHAKAFTSLTKQSQDYNPECIPCHTTGFGYTRGFIMPDLTSETEGIQCEMCHGAGGEHSETQNVPYGGTTQSTCTQCHTAGRSPKFDYSAYYLRIKH
ncbi:MAG: metallophosphoesterase [Deltaproteobacteria bacterium]|nr:metallophosphoesterase [Deltaproteobacteria bacterium]